MKQEPFCYNWCSFWLGLLPLGGSIVTNNDKHKWFDTWAWGRITGQNRIHWIRSSALSIAIWPIFLCIWGVNLGLGIFQWYVQCPLVPGPWAVWIATRIRLALIVPSGLGGNGEFERKCEEIWEEFWGEIIQNEVSLALGGRTTIKVTLTRIQ